MRAEKAVARHGIPALLPCLLSPHLPKALVVLLSHSGAAGPGQSLVSVLQTARGCENFLVETERAGRDKKAYLLLGLWEHLQFL